VGLQSTPEIVTVCAPSPVEHVTVPFCRIVALGYVVMLLDGLLVRGNEVNDELEFLQPIRRAPGAMSSTSSMNDTVLSNGSMPMSRDRRIA